MVVNHSLSLLFSENDEEDDGVGDREETNSNKRIAEQEVFAAHCCGSCQNERFGSLEWRHVEMILYINLVFARLQAFIIVYFTPELAEVGQARRSHPHDEMLVLHVKPLDVFPVIYVCEVGRDFVLLSVME